MTFLPVRILLLVSTLFLFQFSTAQAQSSTSVPQLIAQSAISIEASTGEILFQKNIDQKRAVASTQKLLTGLIISESGKLDSPITVRKTDGMIQPRNLWITSGSRYKKGKLLEVMLVRSFNDVTKCLARNHSGSQGEFATAMRKKAAQLGMRDSVFLNAHGLTVEGQYSTARDMMTLTRAVWSDPVLRKIVGTKNTTFTYHGGATIPIKNSNDLIHSYSECIGLKTGYTKAAGRCLICAAQRGENVVLAVVLGSSWDGIWVDSEKLLRWSLQAVQ